MYTLIRIFIIGLAVVIITAFDVHYNLTICRGGILMADICNCETGPSNQFGICLPMCYNGYVRNGICLCNDGYILQEGRCVMSIVKQPYQCPPDSKNVNGNCFKDKLMPIICPSGCQRSFMTQTCICKEFGEVIRTCNKGFELRNDRCVRQTEVEGTCSPGYVKVEKDDVCFKSVLVDPVCPDHTIKDVDGTCFRKTVNCSSSCRDGCDGRKYCEFASIITTTTPRPNDPETTTTHKPNGPGGEGTTTTHKPNGPDTPGGSGGEGTSTTPRPNGPGTSEESSTTQRPVCYPENPGTTNRPTPPGCTTTSTGSQSSHTGSLYMTYTYNNISSPMNINLKNENNLNITIVRNKDTNTFTVTNGTETIYEGTDEDTNISQEVDMPRNCCVIYGPRQCAKADDGAWHCWHTRHHRCGSVCRKPKLFIRPRRVLVHKPIIIVPPYYRSYLDYRQWGTHLDCSGCGQNWKLCPPKCSNYDCQSDTCGYEDQESFCETYGGDGCAAEDGCLGDHCVQS